jgi:ATP-dependent Clp protease ATP-binding subunit ClpC
MYERFTERARKVMQLANQEARRFNHEYIGTEHLLLGLIKEGSGTAASVLRNLDIDLRKIRLEVEKIVISGPGMVQMGRLPQTPRAKKVIEYAIEEARHFNHNYVGTEHLLLGLVREDVGVAAQVLMNLGLTLADVREEVLHLLGQASATRPAGTKTPSLDSLGVDLTALASDCRLGPCVGRANEIDRILLVLGCRNERNPLLVGPSGVGKRSIVAGLARLAVSENPPEVLRGRRVVQVSLRQMVLLALDDSEQLLRCARGLAKEVNKAGNVLLCVADLFAYGHDSRLFKSVLDANDVPCVATVTPKMYSDVVANDAVLGHNFQPVGVEPPAAEDVVAILHAHRDHYQDYHGVQIADDALSASAELSERYLTEGCQPTRALRLLDQAAALFRLRHPPAPPMPPDRDLQIQRLEAAKESAVAAQDFEKAAGYRDEADKRKKAWEALLAAQSTARAPIAGVIDAAAVEQAVTKLTGVQFRGGDGIRAKPDGM